MALSIRLVPLPGIATLRANGRSYGVGGAAFVDVPYTDGLVIGPDQAHQLMIIGATTDRPTNNPGQVNWPPAQMYDTTLAKVVFLVPGSFPATWIDITGAAV